MKVSRVLFRTFVVFLNIVFNEIRQVESQVGIVYSPFVRDGDNPDFTTSYSEEDVEVMLNLIADNKFHLVATYSVGAPAEPFVVNSTVERCSSIVHTALAAATFNQKTRHHTLSIFQGLWSRSSSAHRLNSEIEVGFEMAAAANIIYNGTVAGLIFPSLEGFDNLFPMQKTLKNVSIRARKNGLKFGVRLWDCIEKIPTRDKNDSAVKDLIRLFDFIICRRLPNFNTFPKGPDIHKKVITGDIRIIENAVQKEMALSTQIILETGWPGGINLNDKNTIGDMLHFWDLLRSWAIREKQSVFMLEAFDNNWINGNRQVLWGGHYGLWMHSGTEDNSRSAYVKKTTLVIKCNAHFPTLVQIEGDRSGEMTMGNMHIGIILGSIFLSIVAVMIMMIVLYQRVKKLKEDRLSENEIRKFHDGLGFSKENVENECAWARMPYNRKFELTKESFTIENVLLGRGEFGCVYRGRIEKSGEYVAFKRATSDSKIFALRCLLSEIKILSYLGTHENVVSLCGAYTAELAKGLVYVATELCSNGSLEEYLQINGEVIPDSQLLRWSLEIATGMAYISSKSIIHRDMATRNVLLVTDLTAKITDFGLSYRLYENMENMRQNQPEALPWKWMAIESLKRLEFSTFSDVWSYSVVLWEIFSLGSIPYPGQCFDENFLTRLEIGLRMDSPPRMPFEVKEIMTSCWHLEPAQRPSFEKIVKLLSPFLENILNNYSKPSKYFPNDNNLQSLRCSPPTSYLQVGYIDVECMI